MSAAWSGWSQGDWDSSTTTPYVHWWELNQRAANCGYGGGTEAQTVQRLPPFPDDLLTTLQAFAASRYCDGGAAGFAAWCDSLGQTDPAVEDTVQDHFTTQTRFPLPDSVVNPGYPGAAPWFLPDLATYPVPPDSEATIIGVIDTGIALGHRRFRDAQGRTRILSAWQQGATRRDLSSLPQDEAETARRQQDPLPFGRELLAQDIDALLTRHARGPGWYGLDEEAFWRDAGLVEMHTPSGHRALMTAAAHGTAVLDLAAGMEPDAPGATRDRAPIIAINLPSRGPVGLSGTFLEYFVIFAIYRIVGMADALWLRQRIEAGNPQWGDRVEGYPVVINFSFGKQADARDGSALFARVVARLNADRASATARDGSAKPVQSRVHFVLPAGNDNLARGNAVLTLAPGAVSDVVWRVLPEDRTPNFVEVISDALPGAPPAQGTGLGLDLGVVPPFRTEAGANAAPQAGRRGTQRALGTAARIYCDAMPVGGLDPAVQHRVRYTLCVAPTWVPQPDRAQAPSGEWRLRVRNPTDREQTITLNVQTDQSLRVWSRSGLRSRFEDPTYRTVDPVSGRTNDTFAYAAPGTLPRDPAGGTLDRADVVRRTGSMSALAHADGVVVIAGHRGSDGRPADYSGTGHPAGRKPTVSLPCDDSPTAQGLPAAGSRDGTVRTPSGTSFAAAMATRAAARLLRGHPGHGFDLAAALAAGVPAAPPAHYGSAAAEKVGAGRIAAPDTGRFPRN